MKRTVWKIYCLTFQNGKRYVGQTKRTLKKRFKEHCDDTSKRILRFAIRKYGKETITLRLLDITFSQEDADRVEDGYIMMFGTLHPLGYNMQRGGQFARQTNISNLLKLKYSRKRLGIRPNDITRKKMSLSKLGKNNHFYGRRHTQLTKNLISLKKKGVPNLLKRKVNGGDIELARQQFKTQEEQARILGISRRPIYEYNKKNNMIKTRQRRTFDEIQNALDQSYDPLSTKSFMIENAMKLLSITHDKMIRNHLAKTTRLYTFFSM